MPDDMTPEEFDAAFSEGVAVELAGAAQVVVIEAPRVPGATLVTVAESFASTRDRLMTIGTSFAVPGSRAAVATPNSVSVG